MMLGSCGDRAVDTAADPTITTLGGADPEPTDSTGTSTDQGEQGAGEVSADVEVEAVARTGWEYPKVPAPDDVIDAVQVQLDDAPDGVDVLDSVDAVDTEADVAPARDGQTRNSSGELVLLDDAGSLACAHVEIALGLVDSGNAFIATEKVASAAHQAGQSEIEEVRDWVEPLSATIATGSLDDVAPLVGFLSVCAAGGYEL